MPSTHLGKLVYYTPMGLKTELYGICGGHRSFIVTCFYFNGQRHDFDTFTEDRYLAFHITHSDDISIYIEPRYQ